MKNITINLIINAVSLGVAAWLLGIGHIDPLGLLIAAAVFGLLNSFVMPIIRFFAIPVNFLSFGIFNIILNAALLKVVLHYVPTAIGEPIGWIMAVCIGGIMGLCNSLLNYFLK